MSRFKSFFINIGSSYAHIILSVVINIIYVPTALKFMGIEKYGTWIVLLTMINYLSLANFGIPTAVTNLIAQASDDSEKVHLLKRGFAILCKLSSAALVLGGLIYFFIYAYTTWLVDSSYEIKAAGVILVISFILRLPFQISNAAFIGSKRIYINKIYDLANIVLTFISLLIAIYFNQDLIFLALVSGTMLLLLSIHSLISALKMLNIATYSKPEIIVKDKSIYTPGLSLFGAGLGSLIVWNTDNIIISKFLGFQDVAVYSTAFRLFSFGYMSFNLVYGVLIPYYGQYFKRKQWNQLENLFILNIIIIPFIAICVWLVGWLFAKEIIILWLGNDALYAGTRLYFILGAYGLCLSYVGAMFNLLTCLNLLKSLFLMTIMEAGLNLGASVLLVRSLGYDGVALGTLLASMLVPLLFLPYLIQKNEELELKFPFKKMLFSVMFYVLTLSIFYALDVGDCDFSEKCLIVVICIGIFIGFQYLLNKKIFEQILSNYKLEANEKSIS